MGLLKQKTLSNLDVVTYWRIVRLNHLAKDGTDVVLGGFTSKEVSDQVGDLGIKDVVNFHFEIDKADFTTGNPYETAYSLIVESKIVNTEVSPGVFEDVETNEFVNCEEL